MATYRFHPPKKIGNKGAHAIEWLIEQGHLPENCIINLGDCHVGGWGKVYIGFGIASKGIKPGTTLIVPAHFTERKAIQYILRALSADAPDNLTLDFSNIVVGKHFLISLGHIIKTGCYSKGLNIIINNINNKFTREELFNILSPQLAKRACKRGLNIIVLPEQEKKNAKITAYSQLQLNKDILDSFNNSPKAPPVLMDSANKGKNAENKSHGFRTKIGYPGVRILTTYIHQLLSPENFVLNLCNQSIGKKGKKQLASALQDGGCRDGLKITVPGDSFFQGGDRYLIRALSHQECPKNLTLYFCHQRYGERFLRELILLLKQKTYPEDLTLIIHNNHITDEMVHNLLAPVLGYYALQTGLKIHIKGKKLSANIQTWINNKLSKKDPDLAVAKYHEKNGCDRPRMFTYANSMADAPKLEDNGTSQPNVSH